MDFWKNTCRVFLILLAALIMSGSVQGQLNASQKAHFYTARYEFKYTHWMIEAMVLKLGESGLSISDHLPESVQHNFVLGYFELVAKLDTLDAGIEQIYADPAVSDPDQTAAAKLQRRNDIQTRLDRLAPIVEEILQHQVAAVFVDEGIDLGGQTVPPVLYHTTPLPKALIISPRDRIQQDANISLLADLPLDKIEALENEISGDLDVSVLIVDIGGVGVYPTMIEQASSLTWVVQTIAHEWTHNYLSLHPLGMNYETNNDLRTMNETTASLVGEEIGNKVIARYYPELATGLTKSTGSNLAVPGQAQTEEVFDFNAEMNTTRVTVDGLLAEGKVDEAESYMEARREVFVAHGYTIRKLNQAYFAFYGGYASTPGGAAGEDPVGPAVRQLRSESATLVEFLRKMAWMSSFGQLQKTISR